MYKSIINLSTTKFNTRLMFGWILLKILNNIYENLSQTNMKMNLKIKIDKKTLYEWKK